MATTLNDAVTAEVVQAARLLVETAAVASDRRKAPGAARVLANEGIGILQASLAAALRGDGRADVRRLARLAAARAEEARRLIAAR